MAKRSATFVCQSCGAVYKRWKGKCEACGELEHHCRGTGAAHAHGGRLSRRARPAPRAACSRWRDCRARSSEAPRMPSGIAELDRVTGGGFVTGSVILLGGDPGIGKSTLLMQASRRACRAGPSRRLHLGRRGGRARCGFAPSGLGLARRPVRARGRDQRRGHHRDAVARRAARRWPSSTRSRPCGPKRWSRRPAR